MLPQGDVAGSHKFAKLDDVIIEQRIRRFESPFDFINLGGGILCLGDG